MTEWIRGNEKETRVEGGGLGGEPFHLIAQLLQRICDQRREYVDGGQVGIGPQARCVGHRDEAVEQGHVAP